MLELFPSFLNAERTSSSVFHPGEQLAQEKAGAREAVVQSGMEDFVRTQMPGQHSHFFNQQPMLFVGAKGNDGNVWASALLGKPGFLQGTRDGKALMISPLNIGFGDPLRNLLKSGAHLGCLGLELHTRRRNRLNGTVHHLHLGGTQDSMELQVDLSFGNCPKGRHLSFDWEAVQQMGMPRTVTQGISILPDPMISMILEADTFFLASCFEGPVPTTVSKATIGCDISHRGGSPGFVSVRGSVQGSNMCTELHWPDFSGNNMYQSLGNLLSNPACGLLFIDFNTGDTLQLTGSAVIDYHDTSLPGALRTIVFSVDSFVHTLRGLPLTQQGPVDRSPFNPLLNKECIQSQAGDLTSKRRKAPHGNKTDEDEPSEQRSTWGTHTEEEGTINKNDGKVKGHQSGSLLECVSIREEASGIKTFELSLPEGNTLDQGEVGQYLYKPGQWASFEFDSKEISGAASTQPLAGATMMRTWTVSSHPSASQRTFNITIKRAGLVSSWMHDYMKPGMSLNFRGFGGDFTSQLLDIATYHDQQPLQTASSGSQMENYSNKGLSSAAPNVLLLAAGVGVTPMRPILLELLRTMHQSRNTTAGGTSPPCSILMAYWVRNPSEAAFVNDIISAMSLASSSYSVTCRLLLVTTLPDVKSEDESRIQFAAHLGPKAALDGSIVSFAVGRISKDLLKDHLLPRSVASMGVTSPPLDQGENSLTARQWQVLSCGPPSFQAVAEKAMFSFGLPVDQFHTESFAF